MIIQELPPNIFTYGNYGADIPFTEYIDNKKLYNYLKGQKIIGYCYSPEFKTLKDYPALMIQTEDFGEHWSHIPDKVLKMLKKIIIPRIDFNFFRKRKKEIRK